jgi:hypothetical protein
MKRWIFATLCCFLLYPTSAFARAIAVDAKDNPLQITGWLDEENTLVGSIRLSAPTAVEQLTFLASDLKRQNGGEIIARQQIQFIGEPKLQAGIPKDFQVKVSKPELPGTYRGEIEVLLPGQPRVAIPLTLLVKARPNLVPLRGNEQVQLNLTRCNGWLDCGLARLLLPASAFLETWDLAFDNGTDVPVQVTGAEVVLKGEQTGYPLTSKEIQPPELPQTLAADRAVWLPLKWTRSQIPPDRYAGAVYLTLEGAKERLVVPIDLRMRISPLLPLLVLFLGILLGRLVKYMQERGIPQAEALGKVKELERQLDKAESEDRQILVPMAKDAKQLVQQMQLEAATTEVEKIQARWDCLQQLRSIEQELEPIQSRQVQEEEGILNKIQKVRTKIKSKQDEEAKKLLEEVRQDVENLEPTIMMGQGQTAKIDIQAIVNGVTNAVSAVSNALQSGVQPPVARSVLWVQKTLMFLSGSEFRAEATYWFARPLFSLALLVGLSVVGLRSLYVEKGATFGADPFADYLGLILWGLSADVASRSLSSLSGGEEKKE